MYTDTDSFIYYVSFTNISFTIECNDVYEIMKHDNKFHTND